MNTGPRKPLVASRAAKRMFSRLPASSSFWRLKGMLATRLVSRRGAQKESWMVTSVNGTGRNFSKGCSEPNASGPANSVRAKSADATVRRRRRHRQFSDRSGELEFIRCLRSGAHGRVLRQSVNPVRTAGLGCRYVWAGEFCVISPLTGVRFIVMVTLRFGWAPKHGELIGFNSTQKQ